MRHHCTACSREFYDDSGGHPRSGAVHCVFCGARISARHPSGVPFGDVPRQASFALGVISGGGSGFPDTLRQFRVRPVASAPSTDSLSPLARAAETEADALPATVRGGTFWISLLAGVAAGVALASGFTSLPKRSASMAASVSPPLAGSVAPASVTPPASVAASAAPTALTAAPSVSAAPPRPTPVATPAQERRFLLERARAYQRQYRLEDAERLYRQVLLRHSRSDSEALAGLGELALLRGTTDLAAAHFERALAANADYIPALLAVADLRWQAGDVEAARRAYQDIVERYSADLYPPYVVQRGQGIAPPRCDHEPEHGVDAPVAAP